MKLELTLPEGHSLALESGSPTKDGSRHWRAWVRRDGSLDLRGGDGWSAQEAIDKAVAYLHRVEAITSAPRPPDPRLAGLKLNLNILPKKG